VLAVRRAQCRWCRSHGERLAFENLLPMPVDMLLCWHSRALPSPKLVLVEVVNASTLLARGRVRARHRHSLGVAKAQDPAV
jgi:hypothetical protein